MASPGNTTTRQKTFYYEDSESDRGLDFGSDDSVRDKDYVQSDSESETSSGDEGQENNFSNVTETENGSLSKRGSLPTPDKAPPSRWRKAVEDNNVNIAQTIHDDIEHLDNFSDIDDEN